MKEFLSALVAFMAANGIIPEEIEASSGDREGTYINYVPDDPDNIISVIQYEGKAPTIGGKGFVVRYVQFYIRNTSNRAAETQIEQIFQFVNNRPDYIEDISEDYWVIFDTNQTPVRLKSDTRNRFLYSLSVPIKTKS